MEEIRALQKALFEAQQGKAVNRLTDSNTVDLVRLLIDRGMVELIMSGQGYITPKQLTIEIKDELLVGGGRISITNLADALNVDLTIIEGKAEAMSETNPNGLIIEQSELIADYYLDDVATEINSELQEAGQITLGDIATRYNFSSEFLASQMRARLGRLIDGQMGAGGVIYTSDFVDRHMARMRGTFSAVTTPGPASRFRSSLGFQESLFTKQLETLVRTKRLNGTFQKGGGIYTPEIHGQAQSENIEGYWKDNGYVEYTKLLGMGKRGKENCYAKEKFPDGINLDSCHCSRALVESVEAELENCVADQSWFEAGTILPQQFSAADLAMLLDTCKSVKGKNSELVRLETSSGGLVVSQAMLNSCASRFEANTSDAVAAAVAAGKLKAPSPEDIGASSTTAWSDEEDSGKRSRAKSKRNKGKQADQNHGNDISAKQKSKTSKKNKGKAKAATDTEATGSTAVTNTAASLAPSEARMAALLMQWYDDQDLGNEPAVAIAAHLRPALCDAYSTAHRSAFAGAAHARKKAQKLFETQFETVHDNFQLFLKGAVSISSAPARRVLEQHLLKEHGTDLVALLIQNQAMHHGVPMRTDSSTDPSVLSIPAELRVESGRKTLIERLPEDVAEPLSALAAMLGGRQAESFARRLPAACEACSLRLSSLDRKREKQLVFQHRQALIASLDNEVDPLSALRIATQLLVCTRHNSVVDLPNKGVPDLVAHLVNTAAAAEQAGDDNDKDLAVMALDAYHQQARKYLLCMANDADDDTKRSLQAELELALPNFKGAVSGKAEWKKSTPTPAPLVHNGNEAPPSPARDSGASPKSKAKKKKKRAD